MSSIYNINNLSTLFSEKTGHKSDASLSIIMELFHLVADGLKESGNVKVKGFGEFIVDAGNQVVFKPEETLEDRINEPFSIFEPIEVEPELTAAMLEGEETEKTNEDAIEEVSQETAVIEPTIEKPEIIETPEPTPEPAIKIDDTKLIEAENRANEAQRLADEMKHRAVEAEKKAEEAQRKILDAQRETEELRREAAENLKRAEEAAQKVKYVPVNTDSGKSVLMLILGLCIGIILGGAAVYFIPFLIS